jgi:glycosyltransferase involved in cell wall biosynthesis
MRYRIRLLAGHLDSRAGSHVYHRELIRRLCARGHEVSVVCFQKDHEASECADWYEIPPAPFENSTFVWRFTSLRQYWRATRMLAETRLPDADIMIGGEHLFLKGHQQSFPSMPWMYLPHSLTVSHEIRSYRLPPVMHFVTSRLYKKLQVCALNQADRTLRFTQRGCDALLQHYGRTIHPRFAIIPLGVELPVQEAAINTEKEVRLLSVGRLAYSKRIDFAIATLSKLQNQNWVFDLVGDGDMRPSLEDQVRRAGLSDRIRIHGFQSDLGPYYQRADLFLFPSRLESLGVVLLEAMSHGVPCLAFLPDGVNYCNVNDEIIENGRTGLLAKNDSDFLQHLRSVLINPEQLLSLGQMARRQVMDYHTWGSHLDQYEQLFDELHFESTQRTYARQDAAKCFKSPAEQTA